MSILSFPPLGPYINYLKKVKKYLEYKLKPYIIAKNTWERATEYILISKNGLPIKILIEYGNFFKTPMINIETETENHKIVNEFLKRFPYTKVMETKDKFILRYRVNIYSAIYVNKENYEKDKETIKKTL